MSDSPSVVALDRIEPGVTPDYCCHGRATCMWCDNWVWLGHATYEIVAAREVLPCCMECANELFTGAEPLGRIEDHLRKDGPH